MEQFAGKFVFAGKQQKFLTSNYCGFGNC